MNIDNDDRLMSPFFYIALIIYMKNEPVGLDYISYHFELTLTRTIKSVVTGRHSVPRLWCLKENQ